MAHPSGNIAIKNLKHRKEPHFHCCSQPGAASMCSSTMHYLAHAIKVQVLIRVGYHQGKPPSSEGWLNPMLHCLNEVVWTAGIGMSQIPSWLSSTSRSWLESSNKQNGSRSQKAGKAGSPHPGFLQLNSSLSSKAAAVASPKSVLRLGATEATGTTPPGRKARRVSI